MILLSWQFPGSDDQIADRWKSRETIKKSDRRANGCVIKSGPSETFFPANRPTRDVNLALELYQRHALPLFHTEP
jgi:hypothetical protein